MKTYLRILSYGKEYSGLVPLYFLFVVLSVVFGLLNFGLLIPLLNIIFGSIQDENLLKYQVQPEFNFSIETVKGNFYYFFNSFLKDPNQGKLGALKYVCAIIIASVFFANVFRYLAERILTRIRAGSIRNIRKAIFDNVSQLHLGFFTNEKKGDIMARLTSDVQELEYTVSATLSGMLKDPISIIGYFIFLFYMSAELTFFCLIYFPISSLILAQIVKSLKKQAIDGQNAISNIMSMLDETLSGIKIVNAFNARGYVTDKFDYLNNRYSEVYRSMQNKRDLASPVSEFLGVTLVTGLLLYGGMLVLNKESSLTGVQFIAYIILIVQTLIPVKSMSSSYSTIQRGLVAGERIFELTDAETLIKDSPNAIEIKDFTNQIEFVNVGFAYKGKQVLHDINLKIEKGRTIALVGPSGGGKSTLADLLPRFYDVQEGDIRIDSLSLKECTLHSLRNKMGIVGQEAILFNDTIFNNIAFGKIDASLQDVEAAAKIANAHDFIVQTENGYQTVIGERGSRLSGGQRQRLSIARAVLRNPEILILDEATSALDNESEKLVQEALNKLMKGRTSLVIAHRLTTIQQADEIVVIDKGRIVEQGPHDFLLAKDGLYKKLWGLAEF
ncbi:MAG: ABC transporter ATP-binding protein [Opitutaceae bacterium]|nr:ABC transporter ATP-binding protein [Cytophagales bacterium]